MTEPTINFLGRALVALHDYDKAGVEKAADRSKMPEFTALAKLMNSPQMREALPKVHEMCEAARDFLRKQSPQRRRRLKLATEAVYGQSARALARVTREANKEKKAAERAEKEAKEAAEKQRAEAERKAAKEARRKEREEERKAKKALKGVKK